MSRARLVFTLLLGAVAAALTPSSAHAGWYQVQSCYPDGVAPGWVASDVAHTTAYVDCGSASTSAGLRARNVIDGKYAPGFSAAAVSVGAPPGTYFDWMSFDADLTADVGWSAGVYDFQNRRWAWCGRSCFTSFGWRRFEIPLSTTSVGAMVMCAASKCGPDTKAFGSLGLRNVTLRVQDPVAPTLQLLGGSLLAERWLRGSHSIAIAASDNTGLRAVRLEIDGRPYVEPMTSCDFHRLAPCTPSLRSTLAADLRLVSDGRHELSLVTIDAAANTTRRSIPIRVDNTSPERVSELASDAPGWVPRSRFSLTWTNPTTGTGSPIRTVFVQLCSEKCQPIRRVDRNDVSAASVDVPAAGRWRARVWVGDEAGNANPASAEEIELHSDSTPPALEILERDESRPGVLEIAAVDELSGISSAEIEVRRDGDTMWHALPVSRTQRGFSAVVDDEVLPAGRYTIRARATDRAGNDQSVDGGSIDLPFRVRSELSVGKQKRVRMQGIGGRKFRKVLVEKPRIAFGRPTPLRGRLTTPGGNPLANRDVDIAERPATGDTPWVPVASVRTNEAGRFKFRALPGPTRQLRFRYGGTPTIRGQTQFVTLRVRAASTLRVSQRSVVNGEEVWFSGTVQGEVPSTGKLLQLQVFSRGMWLTFATPRADQRGRWRHPYRFTATRGVTRYRFRVRLPREAGFPYVPGTTRQVRVKVVGL